MGIAQFPQLEGHGVGRQHRAPWSQTSPTEPDGPRLCREEEEEETGLAGSRALCQDLPRFPGGKAAAAALTQPMGTCQISNIAGRPWGCCFARPGRLPAVLSRPGSAVAAGTGRDLLVHQ